MGLKAADFPGTGRNVADELTQKIATIGENMSLRRMETLSVGSGSVVSYIHNSTAEGLGPDWCACRSRIKCWQSNS